jgi:cell division protein FtsQ
MLKRINWKAIFKGFAWLVCLAGVVVMMSFIDVKKHEVKCSNIKILIPGADNFIEREEIDAILKQGQGQLIGRNLTSINIHEIEKSLKSNPYIAFAKVFTDMDGVIHIEVKQRQPVLRVLNAGGQDYYIDRDGFKMPMSPNFTADVLVATGNILEGFGGKVDTLLTPLAVDLYRTALYMKKDSLWDAQIEQIYVTDKFDIELIPRVGNQRIILGNADSLQTKMNNLLAFYKQAMPLVGWNAYKTINLKYINQIVCEKNDSLAVKKVEPIVTDSTTVINNAADSVIQDAIQSEIKKATEASKVPNQPAGSTGKTVTTQAPPTTLKSIVGKEKAPEKTAVKVQPSATNKTQGTTPIKTNTATSSAKPKQVATPDKKEKTDTKKNK